MKQSEIVWLLPEIFQHTYREEPGNVLAALLGVMEHLHARDEDILENLECYFNPNLLPAEKHGQFLPFLARWVDLDWVLPPGSEYEAGLDRLQNLILSASQLASHRGTREGLKQFLERATGLSEFQVKEDPKWHFHIVIRCPPGAKELNSLVQRIVEAEKPAYLTYKLEFSEQPGPGSENQDSSSLLK